MSQRSRCEHAHRWCWHAPPYCSGVLVSKLLLAPGLVPAQRRAVAPAAARELWLDVVSEASHQPLLARLAEQRREYDVVLRTEMQGQRRGVAVIIKGGVVGHLSRPFARRWRPWVLAAESVDQQLTGTATVVAGMRDSSAWQVHAVAPWPGHDVPSRR